MGGYYVPNIQRPGFGYKRRGDNDEEWGDDSPQGGLFSSGMDWKSSQQPDMMAGDNSAPTSRGGADTDDPAVPTPDYWPSGMGWNNNYDSVGSNPPATKSAPSGYEDSEAPIPGVATPPMPAPAGVPPPVSSNANANTYKPYKPGAEQQALKDMIKKGPKRSILGTIAAAAAGAGAGWVNAAGRTHVPVPTQAMRNMTWRAPGGGAWDTKLGQQGQLAQMEQGEEQREQASKQQWAQEQERLANADYRKTHGDYLKAMSGNAVQTEEDRRRDREWQSIARYIGKDGEIVPLPPDGSLPPGKGWMKRNDPDHPGKFIAVRPGQGDEVDAETGKRLHLVPDAEGKYHASPSMINTSLRTQELASADAARATAAKAETQRRTDQHAEDLAVRKDRNKVLAGDAEDRKARADAVLRDQEQRTSDAINQGRNNLLNSAATWRNNELDKLKRDGPALGKKPEQEEADIMREWVRRSQSAYDQWGEAIRHRPGQTAADFTFYPNGSVVQSSEPYRAGGKPVPVGGADKDKPALATPPVTTKTPAAVKTAGQNKTMTREEVQAYADGNKIDYAAAEKVFTGLNYRIIP